MTVFDEGELARLRTEISQSGRAMRAVLPDPIKAQDAVGFRLDPFYVARLKEQGAAHGMSTGEFARKLVIQGLEAPVSDPRAADAGKAIAREVAALRPIVAEAFKAQEQSLRKQTASLREELVAEVASVREALAQTFFALLVMEMETPEEQAREFVNKTIRRTKAS